MGSHCRHCADGVSINFRQDRAGARRDQGGPRRRVAHQAVAVPMPLEAPVMNRVLPIMGASFGPGQGSARGRSAARCHGPILCRSVPAGNAACRPDRHGPSLRPVFQGDVPAAVSARRRILRPLASARLLTGHRRSRGTDLALATVLAAIAGASNAGGFFALGAYTSHMTGYLSQLADNLVAGQFRIAAVAVLAGAWFLSRVHKLYRDTRQGAEVTPLKIFLQSNEYLAIVFCGLAIDAVVGLQTISSYF